MFGVHTNYVRFNGSFTVQRCTFYSDYDMSDEPRDDHHRQLVMLVFVPLGLVDAMAASSAAMAVGKVCGSGRAMADGAGKGVNPDNEGDNEGAALEKPGARRPFCGSIGMPDIEPGASMTMRAV